MSAAWTLEEAARKRGALRIAGIDEVGRGPLFGPVVAAAVILPKGCRLQGLTDSKKLSEKKRNQLDLEIAPTRLPGPSLPSMWKPSTASTFAVRRSRPCAAPSSSSGPHPRLSADRRPRHHRLELPAAGRHQGDATSFSIAAASVLAKVHRDRLLVELDAEYPGYGLARHKGYGSPEHLGSAGPPRADTPAPQEATSPWRRRRYGSIEAVAIRPRQREPCGAGSTCQQRPHTQQHQDHQRVRSRRQHARLHLPPVVSHGRYRAPGRPACADGSSSCRPACE
jgi:ribonuclease HII